MDKINLQVIRECFGRVVYSHKVHEKEAERLTGSVTVIKWGNIILTAITSGTLISTLFANTSLLIYISALFSFLALVFTAYQLHFNPEKEVEQHKQVAKELLVMREKYVNFIADITNEALVKELIVMKRDQLLRELELIYKFAPQTESKSYLSAQKALKVNEELTFSDEEIDHFLPGELKIVKSNTPQKD